MKRIGKMEKKMKDGKNKSMEENAKILKDGGNGQRNERDDGKENFRVTLRVSLYLCLPRVYKFVLFLGFYAPVIAEYI